MSIARALSGASALRVTTLYAIALVAVSALVAGVNLWIRVVDVIPDRRQRF